MWRTRYIEKDGNDHSASILCFWMWKEKVDPFAPELAEWCQYSGLETVIIEEVYQVSLPETLLDDYHINFIHFLQISNNDIRHQQSVRRVVKAREKLKPRKERFLPDLISATVTCTTNPGPWLAGIFCHSTPELLNIMNS